MCIRDSYTVVDTSNITVPADFKPGGGMHTHDTVLLEWTAKDPGAATFDGNVPRVLFRIEQPFANHNGGHLTFNPLAKAGDADFGLLYICLLYTSDAADERSSVDLGGRRIIKK